MSHSETAPITAEMVINEVVKSCPQTIEVFHRFDIDSCCGGADSIRAGAEKAGANLADLLEALNSTLKATGQPT